MDVDTPLTVSAYAHAILAFTDAENNPQKLAEPNLNREIGNRWRGRIANQFIRDGFQDAANDRAKVHTQHLASTGYKRPKIQKGRAL